MTKPDQSKPPAHPDDEDNQILTMAGISRSTQDIEAGEGQDPDAPPPEDGGGDEGKATAGELVDVTINGQLIKVTPAVAAVLATREEEFKRKISEQGVEIGRLRAQTTVQVPVPEKREAEPELDVMMFENPKGFVKRLREEMRNDITKELRAQYQEDQKKVGLEKFMDRFTSEYPELADKADFVFYQLNKHWADLEGLKVPEARVRLAEITKQEIANLTRKGDGKNRVTIEGGGTGVIPPVTPKTPAGEGTAPAGRPFTLSDVLLRRREEKRAGAGKRTQTA